MLLSRRRGRVLDEPLRRALARRGPADRGESHLELDEHDDPRCARPAGRRCWAAPERRPAALAGGDGGGGREAARTVRQWLAFNRENPRSIVACIDRARSAARQVRERISSEMWEKLNTLYLFLANPALPEVAERNPHAFFQRIRNGAQLIQGLADATLAHDEGWRFVRLGTYLERADNVAHVLACRRTCCRDDGRDEADIVRWLACCARAARRRRTRATTRCGWSRRA